MIATILNWLDSRTGYRAIVRRALDEELPPGTSWPFTTGSVVTLLVVCQFITGVGLTMYYVPAPSLAYDSVRFIMQELTLGWMLRGLHYWGASFLVVAAVVHMLRVFLLGSYKAPREVTWLSGLLMLLVILGFSLSGYLLPWDQKAYWATTVTINVARGTPLAGEYLADLMRGGQELGALTLGRWYSAHVFLLPAALVTLIIAHIALMRKHGISGPLEPQPGPGETFFPWHVAKDTVVMASVFAALVTLALLVPVSLDEVANVAGDATQHGFARLRFVVGEELLVDGFGHFKHPPRRQFLRVVVAREIAADVAGAAGDAQRLDHVVHFFLEVRSQQAGENLDRGAIDDCRDWSLSVDQWAKTTYSDEDRDDSHGAQYRGRNRPYSIRRAPQTGQNATASGSWVPHAPQHATVGPGGCVLAFSVAAASVPVAVGDCCRMFLATKSITVV